ncbi:MAG: GTP-dependent dephospho-CoA kinase family protein [Halohasta sp.]
MLRLPDSLRDAFKAPFGPVYTDTDELLAAVDATAADAAVDEPPLIAVGDVVTHHLLSADRQPAVAVVDGKTEREAVTEATASTLADPDAATREVENPPGTLSGALLSALAEAIASPEPVRLVVDGEEDLATLPAIVAAPHGASVVYGQPGDGMVHVAVTDAATDEARALLDRFDGDTAAALAIVDGRA